MTKLTERDIKMLTLNCTMSTPRLAIELGITEDAINQRFAWLRKKRTEAQRLVNQLNNFSSMCDSNKKRLTSGERKK